MGKMRVVSNRYEPRRRTASPRSASSRPGAHRQVQQRSRAGLFVFAVAITLIVGAAGVGLLPHLQGGSAASADITSTAFENAHLAPIKAPVTAKPKVETDTAALAAKVEKKSDALPASSGTGRRVVFSQSEQRVWLVEAGDKVASTYLVSGSIHPNLSPGTYAVQLHLLHATAYDYKSHMDYFVQFTRGQNAPIGFHDIPISNDGKLLQTTDQLGTPLSSGCIRQNRPDAIRLWNFAPNGTKVVVTA